MPIVAAMPPHQVEIRSGFDYLAVDADRRRVYAAHTGSRSLLIVNADTSAVIGQVEVGPMHGLAVDPSSGLVYTGDGDAGSVSEVDPVTMQVKNSVDIGRPIDAVAYDPATGRIFADEDSGTQVFVVDAQSFKLLGSVPIPGHDLEYLAVDPSYPRLYQNIPDHDEYVVIDTHTLKVTSVVHTPELTDDHPLQFDAQLREIVDGGKNGIVSVYSADGSKLSQASMPKGVDQCTLDQSSGDLACAGDQKLWVMAITSGAAPKMLGVLDTGHDVHTVAIDPKTHLLWTAWAGKSGDFVQAFKLAP